MVIRSLDDVPLIVRWKLPVALMHLMFHREKQIKHKQRTEQWLEHSNTSPGPVNLLTKNMLLLTGNLSGHIWQYVLSVNLFCECLQRHYASRNIKFVILEDACICK